MAPTLEVAGVAVPAYGATLAIVFIAGLLLLWRQLRPLGVSIGQMLDLAALATGSVLAWLALGAVLRVLGLDWAPGFSSLPILSIGAFALLAYLRRQALPAEIIFDKLAPMAALGLAIQYGVGTLMAGTAFGYPTDLPWGLSFAPGSPAYQAFGAAPLHPVQLYLGALLSAVAAASWRYRGPLVPGMRALLTFIAIAVVYLVLSPLRANTPSLIAGTPRPSEITAILIILLCGYKARQLAGRG